MIVAERKKVQDRYEYYFSDESYLGEDSNKIRKYRELSDKNNTLGAEEISDYANVYQNLSASQRRSSASKALSHYNKAGELKERLSKTEDEDGNTSINMNDDTPAQVDLRAKMLDEILAAKLEACKAKAFTEQDEKGRIARVKYKIYQTKYELYRSSIEKLEAGGSWEGATEAKKPSKSQH